MTTGYIQRKGQANRERFIALHITEQGTYVLKPGHYTGWEKVERGDDLTVTAIHPANGLLVLDGPESFRQGEPRWRPGAQWIELDHSGNVEAVHFNGWTMTAPQVLPDGTETELPVASREDLDTVEADYFGEYGLAEAQEVTG